MVLKQIREIKKILIAYQLGWWRWLAYLNQFKEEDFLNFLCFFLFAHVIVVEVKIMLSFRWKLLQILVKLVEESQRYDFT